MIKKILDWFMNGEIRALNADGKLHKPNGPAAVFLNGDWEWWLYGKRHRYYGPYASWSSWYRHGKYIK